MEQFNFILLVTCFFLSRIHFGSGEDLPHIEESQAHRYLDFTVNAIQLTRYSNK